MELQILPQAFSVCKIQTVPEADQLAPYSFLGVTEDEISLVCETGKVPADTYAREDGWRGFFLSGVLDFSLVGILARISSLLAADGVSIFAVSTFNTDYIFTKSDQFERALALLREAGYTIRPA